MPYFPDNIYQHRNIENKEGVQYDPSKSKILFAEDLKNIIDEIKKIEEVLGLQINKGYDTVKEKIERGLVYQLQRERSDWLTLTTDWQSVVCFRTILDGAADIFPNYSDLEYHIFTINEFRSNPTKIHTRLNIRGWWNGGYQYKTFTLSKSPLTRWAYDMVVCYWGMRNKSEITQGSIDRFHVEQKCEQGTGKYLSTTIVIRAIY